MNELWKTVIRPSCYFPSRTNGKDKADAVERCDQFHDTTRTSEVVLGRRDAPEVIKVRHAMTRTS